jgi:hypothetical protein
MNTTHPTTSDDDVTEVSGWLVGVGMITLVLFPLSVPFLILTAVAVIPLLLPLVAVGLVAAVLAVPVLLVRALRRSS